MGGGVTAVQETPGGRAQSLYAQLLPAFANGAPGHQGTWAGAARRLAHAHSAAPRPLLHILFHVLLVVGATGSPPAPGARAAPPLPAGVAEARGWRAPGRPSNSGGARAPPNANSAYLIPAAPPPRSWSSSRSCPPLSPCGRKHSSL